MEQQHDTLASVFGNVIYAYIGPGDAGEPVITILVPTEG
jgi:hypothetical protein